MLFSEIDPFAEKGLYLSVAVVCELWCAFRLPGSKSLWIFPKSARHSEYRETRIVSFIFLWFLMLTLPKGFDLFVYYLFLLFIEKTIFFCSLSRKERIALLRKIFPPYKKYGTLSVIFAAAGFLLLLLLSFRIGEGLARCAV